MMPPQSLRSQRSSICGSLETGKSPSHSVEEAANAESRAKEAEDRCRKAEEQRNIIQQQVDNLRKQILELERIQRVDHNLNHYGLTLDNLDAYLDLRGQGFGPKSSKIRWANPRGCYKRDSRAGGKETSGDVQQVCKSTCHRG